MSRIHANPPADVVRALQTLKPVKEEDAAFILQMLGYKFKHQTSQSSEKKSTGKPKKRKQPVQGRSKVVEEKSKRRFRKPFPSELTTWNEGKYSPPDWLRSAPRLAETKPSNIRLRIPLDPLFHPSWTRTILNDALSTRGNGGEIDVDKIIREISTAQPITKFPRRRMPTLSRGVQLLIDCGEAMEPFAGDQTLLKASLYCLVGRDKTRILSFQGNPLWGAGSGHEDEWETYHPPAQGTPVLVLTDLGIGNPGSMGERADVREWLEFSKLLKEQGCPLIVFVPYSENRWPEPLKTAVTILQWDRSTNDGTVRRCLRQANRIHGG